MAHSQSLY